MTEEWREIPGLQGYAASSFGRIRNTRRILRLGKVPSGHLTCSIDKRTRSAHQLVAAAFLGPRPDGLVIMHLNHLPADNRPSNLRYGTVGENIRMDFLVGTRCNRGERHPRHKFSNRDIDAIRASELKNSTLSGVYGVHRSTISKIRRHITWASAHNAADSSLVGKQMIESYQMAKAPKTITIAEKKVQQTNLKEMLRMNSEGAKSAAAEAKSATAALNAAKKSADALAKDAEKAAAAKRKEADALVAAAQKAYAAAVAKGEKAAAAAAKGAEKLTAQLNALNSMPVAPTSKSAAPKAVAETAEA